MGTLFEVRKRLLNEIDNYNTAKLSIKECLSEVQAWAMVPINSYIPRNYSTIASVYRTCRDTHRNLTYNLLIKINNYK